MTHWQIQGSRRTWATILFVSFFLLYQISLSLVPREFTSRWFFGADSQEDTLLKATLPDPLSTWNARKHPLYVILSLPLYHFGRLLYQGVPGSLANNLSLSFPSALYGAAGVALAFLTFLENAGEMGTGLLFAVLYGISTATWVFSSFPDTYAVTALFTILFFFVFLTRQRHKDPVPRLASVTALVAYASPPQLLLSLVPAWQFFRSCLWKKALKRAFRYGVLVLLGFCIPFEILVMTLPSSKGKPEVAIQYVRKYGVLHRLVEPASYATVLLNAHVFSVAGPPMHPRVYGRPFPAFFQTLSSSWIVPALLYISLILASLWGLRRSPPRQLELAAGIVIFLLANEIFYVYFNPGEAFLYALTGVFPWLLLLHSGFSAYGEGDSQPFLALVVATLLISNLRFVLFLEQLMLFR